MVKSASRRALLAETSKQPSPGRRRLAITSSSTRVSFILEQLCRSGLRIKGLSRRLSVFMQRLETENEEKPIECSCGLGDGHSARHGESDRTKVHREGAGYLLRQAIYSAISVRHFYRLTRGIRRQLTRT